MELGITQARVALAIILTALTLWLGQSYGYLRVAIGLAVGAGALYLGYTYFRAAGEVPPEQDPEAVEDSGLKYVCAMCGLELRVEVATTDRAPTHCREKMELVRAFR